MGFFSQDCESCGHPLLSAHASTKKNQWMEEVVVITHEEQVIMGFYDGYGRVTEERTTGWNGDQERGPVGDISWETPNLGPTVWHKACWRIAGEPTDYRGSSQGSWCQGFFFDHEHDVPEPKAEADLVLALRFAKNMRKRYEREMGEAYERFQATQRRSGE